MFKFDLQFFFINIMSQYCLSSRLRYYGNVDSSLTSMLYYEYIQMSDGNINLNLTQFLVGSFFRYTCIFTKKLSKANSCGSFVIITTMIDNNYLWRWKCQFKLNLLFLFSFYYLFFLVCQTWKSRYFFTIYLLETVVSIISTIDSYYWLVFHFCRNPTAHCYIHFIGNWWSF